jgi:hypothetical protein
VRDFVVKTFEDVVNDRLDNRSFVLIAGERFRRRSIPTRSPQSPRHVAHGAHQHVRIEEPAERLELWTVSEKCSLQYLSAPSAVPYSLPDTDDNGAYGTPSGSTCRSWSELTVDRHRRRPSGRGDARSSGVPVRLIRLRRSTRHRRTRTRSRCPALPVRLAARGLRRRCQGRRGRRPSLF